MSGTFVNARFTKRLPLITAWLVGFAIQAWLRSTLFGTPIVASLVPMAGVAFILYTFYMVTDPATTPSAPPAQVVLDSRLLRHTGFCSCSTWCLACSSR